MEVQNNEEKSRFEMTVDGSTAIAEYERREGEIIFTHTEVPEAIGGRGIAQQLVKGALDQARAKDLKVVALCGYVEKFIDRHPEYKDLLAEDE
jgi:uncharacterized protein